MATQEEQHSLRIGDIILLYYDGNRGKPREQEATDDQDGPGILTNGYVFSELQSSEHNAVALFPGNVEHPNLPNVHFATFRVLAENKYEAQERLNSIRRKHLDAERDEELQAERALEIEQRENKAKQDRLARDRLTITYGASIQLQHVLTKKYLAVSSTDTSWTENTKLRVHLQSENGEGCIFKILLRYKAHSVEKQVCYNDQVKLESVKTEGQFLHCSGKRFGDAFSAYRNCYEVNLAATDSALTIIPHYRYVPDCDRKALRGGDTVRLYHRKHNCYVVAEGCFAGRFAVGRLKQRSQPNSPDWESNEEPDEKEDLVILRNVHCRERQSENGILKAPSTSANTFWQLEKASDSRSGEPLKWEEKCRIKHLPTRCYLAVEKRGNGNSHYKVTLTPHSDTTTVFQLHPVIKDGNMVRMESYSCIKHLDTDTWLHLEKSEPYVNEESSENHETGEMETARLFRLKATQDLSYDDTFTLEQVDEDLLDNFSYVAAIVPILASHIRDWKKMQCCPEVDNVASAVRELAKFLMAHWQEQPVAREVKERKTKNRQKLLRNLLVLENISTVLQNFLGAQESGKCNMDMCKVCFQLILYYLKGNSRKNKKYLRRLFGHGSRFSKDVWVAKDLKHDVVDLLVNMFRDNPTLISDENFVRDIANHLFQELKAEQEPVGRPRLLRLLGELCICSGKPVPANQRIIVDLLKQHKTYYRTKVMEEGGTKTVMFQNPDQSSWNDLFNIGQKTDSLNEDCQFLIAQLELFANLCKGNNSANIHALTVKEPETSSNPSSSPPTSPTTTEHLVSVDHHGSSICSKGASSTLAASLPDNEEDLRFVTFEEVYLCAKDDKLHPTLRAKYVDLMLVMYVDVGENRPYLETLPFSFKYKEASYDPFKDAGNDETMALTKVKNHHFPHIRDWINSYLASFKQLVASSVEDNWLLVKVLDMLAILVKYGYYDSPTDVDVILERLVSILNGFTDLPAPSSDTDQPKIWKLLRQISHYDTGNKGTSGDDGTSRNDAVKKFRKHGRYLSMEGKDGEGNRAIFAVKQRAMTVMELFFNFKFYLHLMRFIYDFHLLRDQDRPHDEWKPPPRQLTKFWDSFTGVPRSVQLARNRLKYIFSWCEFKFEDNHKSFQDILLDLAKYQDDDVVQTALHLLMQLYADEATLFSKAKQTQLLCTEQSMNEYKRVEKDLPTLQHHMSLETDESNEMVQILRGFTKMCVWDEVEQEPNQQNQTLLCNFGVFTDVLNYVLQHTKDGIACPGRTKIVAVNPEHIPAYVECLKLLKALAHGNAAVQKTLFDHLSQLLEIKVEDEEGMHVLTSTIAKVFQEAGPEICLNVKEPQIRRILQLVFEGGEIGRAELISALHSIVVVHQLDLPVRRNQVLVIKHFSMMREEMEFCKKFLGEGKKEKCMELLNKKTSDDNKDLLLLLMVTDVLATCTVGENTATESICWTVFTVEELLRILNSSQIPFYRKRPFARFLVWVYMNAGGSWVQKGASHLSNSKAMWNYLRQVAPLLQKTKNLLELQPDSQHSNTLRKALSAARNYQVFGSQMVHHDSASDVSEGNGVEFSQVQIESKVSLSLGDCSQQLLPVLLLHLTDGILPLLKCFYTKFYRPTAGGSEAKWSAEILSSLQCLYEPLTKFSGYQQLDPELKKYHRTALTLLKHETIHVEDKYKFWKAVRTAKFPSILTAARKRYEATYKEEIRLNKDFDLFVANYSLAYQGPNTARDQIRSKHAIEEAYSDFVDKGMQNPGPEYLPLGPRFQDLIGRFKSSHSYETTSDTEKLLHQLRVSLEKLDGRLSEAERYWQYNMVIQCLRILRAIIHNEIKCINPELMDRNPKEFRRLCKEKLYPVQNEIAKQTLAKVIPLLSHHNEELTCEVLAFLKVILYSGNHEVQKHCVEVMRKREGGLFHTMQKMLHSAATIHRERQTLLAQVEARTYADQRLWKAPLPGIAIEEVDTATSFQDSLSSRRENLISTSQPSATPRNSKPIGGQRVSVFRVFASANADHLNFQDLSHIKLVMKVLGLMCDGQHREMQNYLRDQRQTVHTINMVAEVADFLQYFYHDLNAEIVDLVYLMLQTLIEMCVGNYDNQVIIFNKQIITTINRILLIDISDYETDSSSTTPISMSTMKTRAINLKGSAVELLEVMLEETSHQKKDLVQQITEVVDVDALYHTLADFYKLKDDPEVERKYFDDDVERELFRTYHILVHIKELRPSCLNAPGIESTLELSQIQDAREFCEKNSESVEVVYKELGEPVFARVHFRFDPKDGVREEVMDKVKWSVRRDTLDGKLRDFLEWMEAVKTTTVHHNWLRKHKLTNFLILWPMKRYWVLLLLSIVMNILLLTNYALPNHLPRLHEKALQNLLGFNRLYSPKGSVPDPISPDVLPPFGEYLLLLGLLHLFFSLWMVAEYFVVNWPNFIIKLPDFVFSIKKRASWDPDNPYETGTSHCRCCADADSAKSSRPTSYSDINILGLRTIFIVLFLLASILALTFRGYFYCICLLYIVINNDILQRALLSTTKNGWALLNVALLGAIVIYIYAVICFAFVHESFFNPYTRAPLVCDTIIQCFVSIIGDGLVNSLGRLIYEVEYMMPGIEADHTATHILGCMVHFVPQVPDDYNVALMWLLLDISYFIIVTTIGLNIVLGIIVDSFSELKNERLLAEYDMKASCFICGIASHEFKRKFKGFKYHVQHEHNMWSYIYYSIYLDQIDTSNHNAIESYVHRMIGSSRIDFFPVREEEEKVKEQSEQLETTVKEQLEMKLKKQSEQLEIKVKEQLEMKLKEHSEQLETNLKEQSEQFSKKLEEQTKELAGEVATLRETLEKLITHSTWLRAQSENY